MKKLGAWIDFILSVLFVMFLVVALASFVIAAVNGYSFGFPIAAGVIAILLFHAAFGAVRR